jgi:hypothetical protein
MMLWKPAPKKPKARRLTKEAQRMSKCSRAVVVNPSNSIRQAREETPMGQ